MQAPREHDTDVLRLNDQHQVVLVDDDLSTLLALGRLLRHEPYELRTTSSPGEALSWISEGNVSLVVADQRMPEMSGTEFLDEVKRLSPGTTGVLLTGYKSSIRIQAGGTGSIREVVEKPWEEWTFKCLIRHLLRERELRTGRRPLGPGEPPV